MTNSGYAFDLICVVGFFHHTEVAQRTTLMKRLAELLTTKGMICIIEQNLFNPVTRHMVSTCPFDADAELVTRRTMHTLINNAGLRLKDSGYCLFFPQMLQWLRPLEKAITWLPLGGQYFVTAEK